MTDVTDDYDHAKRAVFDEKGLPASVTKPVQIEHQMSSLPFKQFLRNNSVLYHFIRDRYHRFLYELETAAPTTPRDDNGMDLALAPHLAHLQGRDLRENFFAIFNESFSPEEEAAWQQTLEWMRAIHQLCREHGIALALIPVPQPNQVSPEEWKAGKLLWGFAPEHMITSPHFQDRLQAFCDQEQMPFINPLPLFREKSLQMRLFYPYDGHFNSAGHRLMAEYIYRALSSQQILPQNIPSE